MGNLGLVIFIFGYQIFHIVTETDRRNPTYMSMIAMSVSLLINLGAYFLSRKYQESFLQNFSGIVTFTLIAFAIEASTISSTNKSCMIAFLPLITYTSTLTYSQ